MIWFCFIPLIPYLAWLLWAALRYPVPLSYNARSLWQRKVSTICTGAAIAVVVGIFVVVLSLSQGISKAFAHSGRADQALVLRPNAKTELTSGIERDRVRILKAHPLVAQDAEGPLVSAECYVVKMLELADGTGGANVAVRGVEPAGIRMRDQVHLVKGRWFRSGLPELVVPRRMQGRFGDLEVGKRLPFAGMEWEIVGVFDAEGSAFDSEIWTDTVELMLACRRDAYSSMLVRLASPEKVDGFAQMVDSDKRLKLDVLRETEYYARQTEAGAPIRILGQLITVILTIGAIFAAMNTMYAAVSGRTSEIGTLRAIGYRRREILASFQWESILLCGLGGVLGVVSALWFNGIQTGTVNFDTFSDVSFAFTITPALMLQGVAFSVLMGILGGFFPAWRASRIPITEAMRSGV
jgi:putative ABC transport system permease protein